MTSWFGPQSLCGPALSAYRAAARNRLHRFLDCGLQTNVMQHHVPDLAVARVTQVGRPQVFH
jgi:hypothetical protein